MTFGMFLAACVPIIVSHFAAKYLEKVAKKKSSLYGKALGLFLLLQYAYFFIGGLQPFKG